MSKCPEQVSKSGQNTTLQCPKHFFEGRILFRGAQSTIKTYKVDFEILSIFWTPWHHFVDLKIDDFASKKVKKSYFGYKNRGKTFFWPSVSWMYSELPQNFIIFLQKKNRSIIVDFRTIFRFFTIFENLDFGARFWGPKFQIDQLLSVCPKKSWKKIFFFLLKTWVRT